LSLSCEEEREREREREQIFGSCTNQERQKEAEGSKKQRFLFHCVGLRCCEEENRASSWKQKSELRIEKYSCRCN
jgi:hypothetical protein